MLRTLVATWGLLVTTTAGCKVEPMPKAPPTVGRSTPAVHPTPPPDAPAVIETIVAPDDVFEYRTATATLVPEVTIVARGLPVQHQGLWREGQQNVTLGFSGSSYLLTQSDRGHGLGGAGHAETGAWQMEGAVLVLTPRKVSAQPAGEAGALIAPEPVRRWRLEGVMLEWISLGPDKSVHRTEGLVIQGPAPSWAIPTTTTWTWTLRRTR